MDQIDGPVDLLKMDIEGSEYDVIADLCQSGRIAQVRTLICEVHGNPATQRQVGELWRQLTEAGFRLSLFDARVDGDPREAPFSVIRGRYYAVIVDAGVRNDSWLNQDADCRCCLEVRGRSRHAVADGLVVAAVDGGGLPVVAV